MKPIARFFSGILDTLVFSIIIIIFTISKFFRLLGKIVKPFNLLSSLIDSLIQKIDRKSREAIGYRELLNLALKNMKTKRTRTYVTISGMTIGIAAIVFLVSIGYGLEHLVINRVARLDEMKQTDVTVQTGSKVKIDEKSINDLKDIPQVQAALPMIASVGRLTYNKSVTDLAVYGVTTDYLKNSAIKPSQGTLFESNDTSSISPEDLSKIQQNTPIKKIGDQISKVKVSFDTKEQYVKVRKEPRNKSSIVGYLKKTSSDMIGYRVWGESYTTTDNQTDIAKDSDGNNLSPWLQIKNIMYKKEGDKYTEIADATGSPSNVQGYVSINDFKTEDLTSLSTSADSELTVDNIDLDTLEIKNFNKNDLSIKQVKISDNGTKTAVVNRSILKIINLPENEAVGKEVALSFVVTGDLLGDSKERIESDAVNYKIIAVIPDESAPFIYVPFKDLRSLGITNFSQVKVVAASEKDLPKIRQQIEVLGYNTHSVVDTVTQITNLFSTARIILALLGIVALAVAALGMFNTLTVSLLERTREVGLMKAMGMKSEEIKDLFLAESLLMGSLGGIFGILLGFVLGKVVELLVSSFAIFKGVGFVTLTYIPPAFLIFIIGISLFVGIFTGIYPARRATKISALNALRYE